MPDLQAGHLRCPRTRRPWHFKLLLVAITLYLGWRLIQGIAWVVQHA